MTRLRSTVGRVGSSVTLTTKFTVNGQLFNPYSVSSVTIYDAENGGNLIATLNTPTNTSLGVYQTTWTIPSGLKPSVYFDRWVWQAQSDMTTQTRVYSFRVDGALELPSTISSPLFVTRKEVNFFKTINKELIQRIVGQKIIYYSVSEKHTNTNDLYEEAIKKTVYTPVEINALVLYKQPVQTNTQFSIDTVYALEVYFHINELQERKVIPREGDFVKYGNILYEIEKLSRPQLVYGQVNNEVMVKAECKVSRKSQFEVIDNIPGV